VEAAQDLNRFRHGLGREQAAAEHAFAQAGDLAVFVDFPEPSALQARDFQADGIRADVNGGKCGHRATNSLLISGACCATVTDRR
jgi:hypothetical protein